MMVPPNLDQLRMRMLEIVDGILPEIVAIRRDLHQHPEVAYEEQRTSGKVVDWLESFGIKTRKLAGTGVVGLIEGHEDGRTVALRADMDALPMTEDSGVPYASVNRGKAHACGHDGHTAILMGTAKVLLMVRGELKGDVKLIFQPAEEGGAGACKMREEGALENPHVDAIFALHSWPDLPAGEIGIRHGVMLAASDAFEIILRGRGAHAAQPHKAIDPIVMSAKVIESLQTIVSRRINPLTPAVITVGKIQGGSTHNVIPDQVTLCGTVRTLNEDTREIVIRSIEQVINSTAEMFGAPKPSMTILNSYPVTRNDNEMVKLIEKVASNVLSADRIKLLPNAVMGAEDFGFYLQRVAGAMFRLGISRSEKAYSQPPLHSANFDFNDEAIPTGINMSANIAVEFLNSTLDSSN